MRTKIFISITFLLLNSLLFAQQNQLSAFNIERQNISKNGIKVLAAYSVTNILYGSIASAKTSGSNKYFHQMNAIWNGVTLGIAGIGLLTAKKEGVLSYNQSLQKQHQIEKLFLFNAGLDVAYVAGGAYIKERSKTSSTNADKLKGYGESVMIQGAVLLFFDGIMYALHKKHGKALYKMGENIELAAMPNGIGLVMKL